MAVPTLDHVPENASFSLHTHKLGSIHRLLAMFKDCILINIVAGIISNPPTPLLPIATPPPPPHPIIQTMQKLELWKVLLTLATTAALGPLLAPRFDSAAGAHPFIISGLAAAFMIIWNGILLRTEFPRLGSILECLGISLALLFFFGLVATFLSGGFSLACWLSGAFCLIPFAYAAITPQPAPAPYDPSGPQVPR